MTNYGTRENADTDVVAVVVVVVVDRDEILELIADFVKRRNGRLRVELIVVSVRRRDGRSVVDEKI